MTRKQTVDCDGIMPKSATTGSAMPGPAASQAVAPQAAVPQAAAPTYAASETAMLPDTSAVIVAGGIGERFGDPQCKQFVDLYGRPLTAWALLAFDAAPSVGEIVLVCSPEKRRRMREQVVEPLQLATPIFFADAGKLRQDSCRSGLRAARTQDFPFVAIHDAARPLIEVSSIEEALACLRASNELDGVVCGIPAADTIKICNERGVIGKTPTRTQCWQAQTPQIFRSAVALEAHESALDDGIVATDDACLVERLGGRVRCISVGWGNMKVTVPEDLIVARAVLEARSGKDVSTSCGTDADSPCGKDTSTSCGAGANSPCSSGANPAERRARA